MKQDCNKCGDYEYCAFQYDKCTGFIPGDNYDIVDKRNETNMEKLTELEWIKYKDNFLKKSSEYLNKKCEINRQERNGVLSEKEAEIKLKELKEKYEGYTDIYNSNKYCIVSDSLELAYKALGQEITNNFKIFLEQQKRYKRKHVKMSGGISGILVGIAITIDDFYYIIKEDETGNEIFDTGVDNIIEVDGIKV